MFKYFICILTLLSSCILTNTFGQKGLTEGAAVENIRIKKLLNSSSNANVLLELPEKLTILDFFGTWCSPCLKALPHLEEIRNQFKDELSIVLVSNETEARLTKFIKSRKSFTFPVIVDDNNEWNDKFQPPSLPYTVVIKQGKVIAITKAEDLTPAAIQNWLKKTSGNNAVDSRNKVAKMESNGNTMKMNQKNSNPIIQLSQDFIYSAKTGDSLEALSSRLEKLDYNTLVNTLKNDDLKKAFWINIYNGYTQAALKENPDEYKNKKAFFTKSRIDIAGNEFSLDDIEHGILRRSKVKWSLGYFNKLFPSKLEKELRVRTVDYRIHFALNCGAKSCPPIAFYDPGILNKQLDLATKAYLSGESSYDSSSNTLNLPKLMSWFRADFGGKKGIIAIARKVGLITKDISPKIDFKNYDWSLQLDNYAAMSNK